MPTNWTRDDDGPSSPQIHHSIQPGFLPLVDLFKNKFIVIFIIIIINSSLSYLLNSFCHPPPPHFSGGRMSNPILFLQQGVKWQFTHKKREKISLK
jgi:hypothetical protein